MERSPSGRVELPSRRPGSVWVITTRIPFRMTNRYSGSTAVITIIAVPTATDILPTSIPATVEPPAATDLPNPPDGDITIDAYVQVTGTGGGGLRLREGPGLDRTVRMLGAEEEIFLVIDGPQQADNYIWWYLEGPFDDTRHGWAVSNFLRLVQNP